MVERCNLSAVPYPFDDIQTASTSMDACDVSQQMSTLLQQMHGLAGVCYHASRSPDTSHEDVSQALGVLYGYLEAARTLFERWQMETPAR